MWKLFIGALVMTVAAAAGTRAQDKVTLRLDWATIGYHAPFYLAEARGYYADNGLDVEINEGKGSGNTVQLVGNGTDTFGYADAAVSARAISQSVPIKVIMGIIRKSPASIAVRPDSGIAKPADLKGKSILSCPGHAALFFLPAYLNAVGVAEKDVKVTTVDCGTLFPLLAQGKADAATGFTPGSMSNLARAGMTDAIYLDYADAGIILPSHGVIANTDTIENKPELVKRFVAATQKGWVEALKDPKAAVAILEEARPLVRGSGEVFAKELASYGTYTVTPGTEGKPFGWQSPQEWKEALALMAKYTDMKPLDSVDAYFTNDFIAAP